MWQHQFGSCRRHHCVRQRVDSYPTATCVCRGSVICECVCRQTRVLCSDSRLTPMASEQTASNGDLPAGRAGLEKSCYDLACKVGTRHSESDWVGWQIVTEAFRRSRSLRTDVTPAVEKWGGAHPNSQHNTVQRSCKQQLLSGLIDRKSSVQCAYLNKAHTETYVYVTHSVN